MFTNLALEEFAQILESHLRHMPQTQPQKSAMSSLKTEEIEQALCAPGRTIFVYGGHNGGNPSLTDAIAAHPPLDPEVATLERWFGTTFDVLLPDPVEIPLEVGDQPLQEGSQRASAASCCHTTLFHNAAADDTVAALHNRADGQADTLVVVDEFDRITTDAERNRLAGFIQNIGQWRVPIRFVLCGVSDSLKKLLGAHESSYQCTDQKDRTFANGHARLEVIDSVTESFEEKTPHYVHLVSEELFWDMFSDPTFARSLR